MIMSKINRNSPTLLKPSLHKDPPVTLFCFQMKTDKYVSIIGNCVPSPPLTDCYKNFKFDKQELMTNKIGFYYYKSISIYEVHVCMS